MPHRNSQKRINEYMAVYFTVSKTEHNYPYFKEPILCELLIEELRLCKQLHPDEFKLLAFSIIYDHLNLMTQPGENFNLSKIMQFVKRHSSRHINYLLGYGFDAGAAPLEGDNCNCRLRGELGRAIAEFDLKLKSLKDKFNLRYQPISIPKFKWQKSYRDHIIRNDKDLQIHYNYTVYNPQKHNLPDNWPYTSLNYEELIDFIE